MAGSRKGTRAHRISPSPIPMPERGPSPNGVSPATHQPEGARLPITPAEKRLHIPLTLDQIPETCSCGYCGGQAQRVYLSYAQPYSAQGRSMVARCEQVPGYHCDPCDFEFYFPPAIQMALTASLSLVRRAGDAATAECVEASLHASRRASESVQRAS